MLFENQNVWDNSIASKTTRHSKGGTISTVRLPHRVQAWTMSLLDATVSQMTCKIACTFSCVSTDTVVLMSVRSKQGSLVRLRVASSVS